MFSWISSLAQLTLLSSFFFPDAIFRIDYRAEEIGPWWDSFGQQQGIEEGQSRCTVNNYYQRACRNILRDGLPPPND